MLRKYSFLRCETFGLFIDHNNEFVLSESAGFSYQELRSKQKDNKILNKNPIIAMCTSYGFGVVGSNKSLKVILLATHEMIHG